MGTKKSVFQNSIAGGWAKISSILLMLLQIPMLLSALGVEEYGRWLVISSFPTWLALANLGFGNVAANEISMAVGAKDFIKAREAYSTALALTILLGFFGTTLFAIISFRIEWHELVNVYSSRQTELSYAMIWLVSSLFLSFSAEVFGGRFRAVRKTHEAILINSFRPWMDLLLMFLILQYSKSFDYIAFSTFCSTILYLFVFQLFSRKAAPSLNFSMYKVQWKLFRKYFNKGIAFQAMPFGNAILYQGNIMIVQSTLGSAAVVLFGTVRMLIRSISQMLDLVNIVIWPELSILIGSGELSKAARLHRIAVGIATLMSFLGVLFLSIFGSSLYEFWVGKSINLPQHLLIIFLFPVPFYALWFTSCIVPLACNKHEGLAVVYLTACSISAIACYGLSLTFGIEGAAFSTLIADIILIPYVLKQSLKLTNDNFRDFIDGLIYEITHTGKLIKLKNIRIFLQK
jgi:O-antigen/teichoic acid export membrane protein